MKYWTNKNKKALLHSLPFAILSSLCLNLYSQTLDAQPNLKNDELTAQTQYRESLRNCSSRFASAECRREASLAFKNTKHSNQIKRRSNASQLKREKSLKNNPVSPLPTDKAAPSTSQSPPRKPLIKKIDTRKKQQPLNKKLPETTSDNLKKPLFKNTAKPKVKKQNKTLIAQPSNSQKAINQAKLSAKREAIDARKAHSAQKERKRSAKDSARRAAGFTIDKP